MNNIQAVNNFVFIVLDETKSEKNGLILPSEGKVKPNRGVLVSIGDTVTDKHIRTGKGKIAIFPKGSGWETEEDGKTYLVLESERIWAVK